MCSASLRGRGSTTPLAITTWMRERTEPSSRSGDGERSFADQESIGRAITSRSRSSSVPERKGAIVLCRPLVMASAPSRRPTFPTRSAASRSTYSASSVTLRSMMPLAITTSMEERTGPPSPSGDGERSSRGSREKSARALQCAARVPHQFPASKGGTVPCRTRREDRWVAALSADPDAAL
jgi:hypothetical protein